MFYLEQRLEGLPLAVACIKVSAYADDAFGLLRHLREVAVVNAALEDFAGGSGLHVNPQKSSALAVAGWDSTVHIGYPYVSVFKVLGVEFDTDVRTTTERNWERVLNDVKGSLISNHPRAFSIKQRVEFVKTFALARLWHVAQVLPMDADQAARVNSAVSNFIWKGSFFRLRMDTACASRSGGGLGLPRVQEKSMALFAGRWQSLLVVDQDCFAAEWLLTLITAFPGGNPPNLEAVWPAAWHYRQLMDMRAYCAPPAVTSSAKENIRELYRVQVDARPAATSRIATKHPPGVDWPQVWSNVWSPTLPPAVREVWYRVAHDLEDTRYRRFMARQKLDPTGLCPRCGNMDTMLHRLKECGAAASI